MPYVTGVEGMPGMVVPMSTFGGFSFIQSFPWGVKIKFDTHYLPVILTWESVDDMYEALVGAIHAGTKHLFAGTSFGPHSLGSLTPIDMTYDVKIGEHIQTQLSFHQLCTLRDGLLVSKGAKPDG